MTTLNKNHQDQPARNKAKACEPVPFAIYSKIDCINTPLTTGLCFPKGHLFEVASAEISLQRGDSANPSDSITVGADANVVNRWHDGSVRWIQVHFVASALSKGTNQATATLKSSQSDQDRVPVSSLVVKDHCFLMDLNGQKILVDPSIQDEHGLSLKLSPASVKQLGQNTYRQRWETLLDLDGQPDIAVQIVFDVWPDIGTVDVSTRIRNKQRAIHAGGLWDLGDKGSFHFRELKVKLSAARSQNSKLTVNLNSSSNNMDATDGPFTLTQYSSGGPAWNCTNHVGNDGTVTVQKNGFLVTAGSREGEGLRASPTVCLSNNEEQLSIAVPEFWQQFPNSITCEPAFGTSSIGLFPEQQGSTYELQGGEQKTKRFTFCLNPKSASASASENPLAWVHAPVRVIPNSNWVQKCNVIPWLPNAEVSAITNSDRYQRFVQYLTSALTDKHSLPKRREAIDEYGWRNFGEFHADHEQTHFAGSGTVVSHYNNQFDLIFGGIQNLIVAGDASWYDLFDPLARHVMDIDIYHTDQDRACFNGGLFWHTDHYVDAQTATHRTYSKHNASDSSYGGGLSNEHNYTTGLLYYYFLTGNEEARESVVSLADWVINMDDGRYTLLGAIDSGNTGFASKTVTDEFHGPGRGVGNSINACLDGWLLTSDTKYMAKAEQLILRCVHPNQDCDALHLADAEGHWSYTVCLTALGRYLHIKAGDDQRDSIYEYVRQTLEHYGKWMAKNEKPSLSVPEELQYPTEAWAAQDFRKANALRIAASCCHDANQVSKMRQAADNIHEAAWKDLYRFGDAHHSARCLSIIMTEGLRQLYFDNDSSAPFAISNEHVAFNEWTMFELQNHRVKSKIKNPIQLIKAVLKNVRPRSIRNSWDAFQRQKKSS